METKNRYLGIHGFFTEREIRASKVQHRILDLIPRHFIGLCFSVETFV